MIELFHKNIDAIFFDFDGVLAESLKVKTDAFYKMYEPYGVQVAEKVAEHHLLNGGVSRFEKFKIYHKEFLNVSLDEQGVQKLAREFSSLVSDGVVNSEKVKGGWDFVNLVSQNHPIFIITGTPTDEMKMILKKLKRIETFEEVLGSPNSKIIWCDYLLKKYQFNPVKTWFVGDATSDLNAAKEFGLNFILRRHQDNDFLAKQFDGLIINDFTEIDYK